MTRSIWRRLSIVAVLALLAASCGNSGDDDESATTDPPTEETAAPAEAATTAAPDDSDDGSGNDTSDVDDSNDDGAADDRDTFVSIEGVPGVSDDEIGFAAVGTDSNNPLGTCVLACMVDGIQSYFDYRNSEGGLFGRELVVAEVLDDELGANQVRSLEVISGNESFGVFSATQIASGWGDLNDAGVPVYAWNIHATEFAGREGIFGNAAAQCADCTSRVVPYLVKDAGATTVASLGYGVSENSKVCSQATVASIEKYSAEIGGATVGYFNDEIEFGLPNGIGPQVTAMKDAGVDFIATCMDLNGMKTLAQEMQRQGLDATLYHPNTYNQSFVTEAEGVFEGDYVGVGFLPFEADTDNESQAAFKQYMDAGGRELTELAMVGWITADLAFQSILAAGPEFDRQASIDAMNAVTDYDAGGLINPIDWTRQHVPPTEGDPANDYVRECTSVVQIVDGVFETLADPATPWLCWPNDTLDWSEPETVAFN